MTHCSAASGKTVKCCSVMPCLWWDSRSPKNLIKMEDILKYENREELYESLLKDLNLKKVDEKYNAQAFGNFYIILAAKEFLIQYVNDRDFLTIEFASNYAPPNKYGLTR